MVAYLQKGEVQSQNPWGCENRGIEAQEEVEGVLQGVSGWVQAEMSEERSN